jgi:hypothetical protein
MRNKAQRLFALAFGMPDVADIAQRQDGADEFAFA